MADKQYNQKKKKRACNICGCGGVHVDQHALHICTYVSFFLVVLLVCHIL
jgi:hypothetical protein